MDYKLELTLGYPITYEDIGTIYQPKIKEIIEYNKLKNKEEYEKFKQGVVEEISGIQPYDKLLTPFLINKESLEGLSEEELNQINEFDLIIHNQMQIEQSNKCNNQADEGMLDILMEAIKFFYKSENVNFIMDKLEDGTELVGILINDEIFINRDNYTNLEKIILEINKAEKPKIEKPPEFKSERQRDIWEKIQKGRQRKKDKESLNMATLINIIKFAGKTYIPSTEILNMTIWEVYNAYSSIIETDSYDKNMAMMPTIIANGGKMDNIKHISQSLKI